jgi:hypothetical protein
LKFSKPLLLLQQYYKKKDLKFSYLHNNQIKIHNRKVNSNLRIYEEVLLVVTPAVKLNKQTI